MSLLWTVCPTVCPRSLDPYYTVTYYLKWDKTSWKYSGKTSTNVMKTDWRFYFIPLLSIVWPWKGITHVWRAKDIVLITSAFIEYFLTLSVPNHLHWVIHLRRSWAYLILIRKLLSKPKKKAFLKCNAYTAVQYLPELFLDLCKEFDYTTHIVIIDCLTL